MRKKKHMWETGIRSIILNISFTNLQNKNIIRKKYKEYKKIITSCLDIFAYFYFLDFSF